MKPKFLFGDIVVINDNEIGIILKSWQSMNSGKYAYDVYNRMTSEIGEFKQYEIERYMVRHKYLNDEEIEWQNG